jgi:hypothetical protein
MSDNFDHATPQHAIAVCEASVRDIAEGNLFDARDVLAESQRALDTYLRERATVPTARRGKPAKSIRAA